MYKKDYPSKNTNTYKPILQVFYAPDPNSGPTTDPPPLSYLPHLIYDTPYVYAKPCCGFRVGCRNFCPPLVPKYKSILLFLWP